MNPLVPYWTMVLWGLAVFISWVGWGTLVAQFVRGRRNAPPDWALKAGWGMALTLAVGGVLLCLEAAIGAVLEVQVLVGVGLWAWDLFSRWKRGREQNLRLLPPPRRWPWWQTIPMALAIVGFLGTINVTDLNLWDDFPAYFPFIQKIIHTGTLIDPFSWRRLSTYGGQQYLQASIVVMGDDLNASIVDAGLCPILLLGLLAGMFPRHAGKKWLWFLGIGCLAIWMDVPRINTQSQISGAVLFLTLYRTLHPHRGGEHVSLRMAMVAGIVAAGVATFRMSFIPVVGLAILLSAAGFIMSDRARWKAYAARAGVCLAVFGLALLPWAIVLYRSSNSLLYPLFRGNQRPEYDGVLAAPLSLSQHIVWTAQFLGSWNVLLLLFPLALLLHKRQLRGALPFFAAAAAGTAAIGWAFTMTDYENLYRYAFPMLFPASLLAFVVTLRTPRHIAVQISAALMAAAILLTHAGAGARNLYDNLRASYDSQTEGNELAPAEMAEEYAAAQQTIPPGARIFSMTEIPTLFDFSRNEIWAADQTGIASPAPGMPLFAGTSALLAYFRSLGISYIVASDFDRTKGPYSRAGYWDMVYRPQQAIVSGPEDWVLAPPRIALMELVDALAATDRLIMRGQFVRVIRVTP